MTQDPIESMASCTKANAAIAEGISRDGILIALKTTLETRARDSFLDVWVTSVNVKLASGTLDVIRRLLPGDGGVDLQHLRRFAKFGDVPVAVRERFEEARREGGFRMDGSEERASANPSASTQTGLAASLEDLAVTERLLIVGSTNAISHATVAEELTAIVNNAVIVSIQVPRLAPTSQEQAETWSSKYWPTVYKKSNPFGPHPSIVSRTEQEIRGDTEKWMSLAFEVALEAESNASGEPVGVVIVERRNGIARPVAVAGDSRWRDWPRKGPGNVTAHAVLRAIAMVAAGLETKERDQKCSMAEANFKIPPVQSVRANQMMRDSVGQNPKRSMEDVWNNGTDGFISPKMEKQMDSENVFQDKPFLDAEKEHHSPSGSEAGYLCHDLEIYCTHEPCVMCSMAIVHSRFGQAVFQYKMPKTGGICADGDLGHGLFWRKELNWTLLAWQWLPSRDGPAELRNFHA